LVALQVDGSGVRVAARGPAGEGQVTRSRDGTYLADGVELLPTVGVRGQLTLLAHDEPEIGFPPAEEGVMVPVSPAREAVSSLDRALALVTRVAPPYLQWLEWALRDVVVVSAEPDSPRSGTSGDWPGLVYLSAPHEPAAVAELLVHEAAHQYQYLARRVGPVDDGSDQRSYWSPLKGMKRPLGRLLAAYHAFGNVALLHRACIEADADHRGYAADRLAALIPALRTTEGHLWENPALTPVGRALLDPLTERLATLDG